MAEDIKANIILRDGYFSKGKAILGLVNELCPWEAARRVEVFDEIVKTICSLPTKETKDLQLDSGLKWIAAVEAAYNDSKDIVTIRFLLAKLTELIIAGSTLKCGV